MLACLALSVPLNGALHQVEPVRPSLAGFTADRELGRRASFLPSPCPEGRSIETHLVYHAGGERLKRLCSPVVGDFPGRALHVQLEPATLPLKAL